MQLPAFNYFKFKIFLILKRKKVVWDFPGSPVVRTPCFYCRGHGFEPWWRGGEEVGKVYVNRHRIRTERREKYRALEEQLMG